MLQQIKAFFTRYRTPLIAFGCVAVGLLIAGAVMGMRAARGYWSNLGNSSESQTAETLEAVVILTEPPTTEAPTTEPPTTEPPTTEPPTEPPAECKIEDVPYYSQHGLLPTGCELVSAKMLLEYYTKTEVDIQDIIDRMDCQYPTTIDGKDCAPHPSEAFIGSPWDPTAFGCFSPIICDMMNDLLPKNWMAVDTTGTPIAELAETYIPQGRPVLIWATISMVQSFPHMGWYLTDTKGQPTDEWYDWLANEHCLVLIGYDEEYYYFNDPYAYGTGTRYSRELVETRCEEMDRYSAVVIPRPEGEQVETYVAPRETTEPEATEPEATEESS